MRAYSVFVSLPSIALGGDQSGIFKDSSLFKSLMQMLRRFFLFLEDRLQGVGADHPDMYIANAVWTSYFLNWAREQAQTMRGSRVSI